MSNDTVGSGAYAGSLRLRNYNGIRGVDFSQRKDEVSSYRSPDMLNMWKNYRNSNGLCIETRPDLDFVKECGGKLYGFYFFSYNNEKHMIMHIDNKLFDNEKLISEEMKENKTTFFVYQEKLYILDSAHYYEYDGTVFRDVVGYIPTTTISRAPLGGGTKYQDVNLLSPYRKNSFCSDGETLEYHLDVEAYDSDYSVVVWINDKIVDNSKKIAVTDKNGYFKYKKNTTVYWYDKDKKELYNANYDKLVNGELKNSYGYIKYKDSSNNVYWYDKTLGSIYDSTGVLVEIGLSKLTKETDNTVVSSLSEVTDYPYVETPEKGIVTFSSPVDKPLTDGSDNVVIQFKRFVENYKERITNCTLVEIFDNRIFFAGNSNFPNVLWHSSLDDPTYCSDVDYYEEGVSDSAIKGIVAGNNALWVLKEPSQTNTTIFYHNPSIDSSYGKIYPSSHSSISTGCLGKARNFRDTIIFFSDKGMEGISSDVTTEQVITHMSSLIDNRLLNEKNYKNMLLTEWENYLLVIIDNHVYLADSGAKCTNNDHIEYEWFYWEFDQNIDMVLENEGILYMGIDNKIYTLTNKKEDRCVKSFFTTIDDEFGFPQMQKITNKRGSVIDINGNSVDLYVKTDKTEFEKIGAFNVSKGRIVPKIKRKKWKSIQLKLEGTTPFYFYSATLECYVTNYLKK